MGASPIVVAEDLTRHYRVALKEDSLLGTLRHFLRRRYQTIRAVEGVSFRILPGEVVGFLGPNGAGKTTTLKMLTGLVHPTRGKALVAGHVPWRPSSGRSPWSWATSNSSSGTSPPWTPSA